MTSAAQFPFLFVCLFVSILFSKFIFNTASDLKKSVKEKEEEEEEKKEEKDASDERHQRQRQQQQQLQEKTMHYSSGEKRKERMKRGNTDRQSEF